MKKSNNWAIVIGINDYWSPRAQLRGAVPDALALTHWLLDERGGAVAPDQLFLLVRPTADAPVRRNTLPDETVANLRDATKDDLIDTIGQLISESGGAGARLFFSFSGHGIVNRQNFVDEQALVMADFTPARPDKAISLDSIREFFINTGFTEQFFFIDACRDLLNLEQEFRLSDFPFPGTPDAARLQTVSQYSLYATTPRLRAAEMGERGAFTNLLLRGLHGAGRAKIYDNEADEYLITVDRLFSYVQEEMDKNEILITSPPAPPLYQKVYKELKGVGQSPVLARLNRDEVQAEKLELYVMPEGIWSNTDVELKVTSENADYNQVILPVKGAPVELPPPLLPMTYTVRAKASGYKPERVRWAFDLYEPRRFNIILAPDEQPSAIISEEADVREKGIDLSQIAFTTGSSTDSGEDESLSDPRFSGTRSLASERENFPAPIRGIFPAEDELGIAAIIVRPGAGYVESDQSEEVIERSVRSTDYLEYAPSYVSATTAELTIYSADSLAPLEITDNKGAIVAEGTGMVSAKSLAPGFYRARLVTPEGIAAEEIFDLEAGDAEKISLDAPRLPNEGIFQHIVDRTQFHINAGGTLAASINEANQTVVNDLVGAIAAPQLTTMLALVSSLAVEHYDWSETAAAIGLPSLRAEIKRDATSALRVIFADEPAYAAGQPERYSRVELGLWLQGAQSDASLPKIQTEYLTPSSSIPGIAHFTRSASPGAHILKLKLPQRPPVNLSIALLKDRLTLIIIHRRADGSERIYGYMPSLRADEYPPGYSPEAAKNLRRMELLQRFYMADQATSLHAQRNAIELLHAKWIDPLAGCLGGYTMLKLGQAQELETAAKNMLRRYEQLSDSHVLAAEYYLSRSNSKQSEQAAEKAFRRALALGMPVFSEGLVRLAAGIEHFAIRDARADYIRELLSKRVRQLLWTAWTEN